MVFFTLASYWKFLRGGGVLVGCNFLLSGRYIYIYIFPFFLFLGFAPVYVYARFSFFFFYFFFFSLYDLLGNSQMTFFPPSLSPLFSNTVQYITLLRFKFESHWVTCFELGHRVAWHDWWHELLSKNPFPHREPLKMTKKNFNWSFWGFLFSGALAVTRWPRPSRHRHRGTRRHWHARLDRCDPSLIDRLLGSLGLQVTAR